MNIAPKSHRQFVYGFHLSSQTNVDLAQNEQNNKNQYWRRVNNRFQPINSERQTSSRDTNCQMHKAYRGKRRRRLGVVAWMQRSLAWPSSSSEENRHGEPKLSLFEPCDAIWQPNRPINKAFDKSSTSNDSDICILQLLGYLPV